MEPVAGLQQLSLW